MKKELKGDVCHHLQNWERNQSLLHSHLLSRAKNEGNRRLGLLSEQQQVELIDDEADRLQRLKELAEDEA